jgi:AraC-like DNA-binding protein
MRSPFYGFDLTTYWQLAVMVVFILYYIYVLIWYGRWLRENYADLEHKEVWQSLLFAAILFVVYEVYFTNPGEMTREYLAQLETLAIIAFLLWRVETLEVLNAKETVMPENILDVVKTDGSSTNSLSLAIPDNIKELLDHHCEAKRLYLQHDLTLQQLATAIGTNRTYLSAYFAQQGITYNTYINRLRVEHFMRLYRDSIKSNRPMTAVQLAPKSGFRSYSTFATAFKYFNGQTVTSWMKSP